MKYLVAWEKKGTSVDKKNGTTILIFLFSKEMRLVIFLFGKPNEE